MKTIYTYLRLLALTCALAIGLNSCKEEEGPNTPSDSAEVIFEVPRLELGCDGEEASVAFGIVNPVEMQNSCLRLMWTGSMISR